LDALTALRFIAAAMIVVHHSRGNFGFSADGAGRFVLDQAVSFFFVMSGFILTYVYPRLDTWEARGRFWLARFARIWPAHLAAFVLLWVLLQRPSRFPTGVSTWWLAALNLSMVQAWVPVWNVFFSYNSVSWSISTEMFLYVLFPLLIWRWDRTWWWKVPLALGVAAGLIEICRLRNLAGSAASPWSVSQTGIVYIHPLARVFEFTVGMATSLLYRSTVDKVLGFAQGGATGAPWNSHYLVMTLVEAGTIGLVLVNMYYASSMAWWLGSLRWPGNPGMEWAVHGPACSIAFALMIYVMAMGAGGVSRLLGSRAGVLLGEISYSVYLIHWIMITFYTWNVRSFGAYPGSMVYAFFWAILLLMAWLVWAGVERPLRRRIAGVWPEKEREGKARIREKAKARGGIWDSVLAPSWRAVGIGGCALALLLVPVGASLARGRVARTDEAGARAVEAKSVPGARGVRFAGRFELMGVEMERAGGGLAMKLAWRSVKESTLKYNVAVHLVDEDGRILAQADYAQDSGEGRVRPGAMWVDTVRVGPEKMARVKRVALTLYEIGGAIESVEGGNRDWAGRRLLLEVDPGSVVTQ
jgi:peptidoglycan/LPS O-acetylase OafA/YrhL